jgi:hypothetical protein
MADLVTKADLETMAASLRQELRTSIDHLALRLTVRLGGIVVIGAAVLATIIKL